MKRRCHECGTNISHRRANALYCDGHCRRAAGKARERARAGKPVQLPHTEYRVVWNRPGFESPRWRKYEVRAYAEHLLNNLIAHEKFDGGKYGALTELRLEARPVGEWSTLEDALR